LKNEFPGKGGNDTFLILKKITDIHYMGEEGNMRRALELAPQMDHLREQVERQVPLNYDELARELCENARDFGR
jgi:hypothetical protein